MFVVDLGKYGRLVMPGFIHEFGDDVHHLCPAGHSPSNLVYARHECLDYFFYKLRHFLMDYDGAWFYHGLETALTFLWGLNCGFPCRDIALYTVWYFRGCKPVAVLPPKPGIGDVEHRR